MRRLLHVGRRHFSLLVMVAGGASLILATMVMRHALSPHEFGVFGLVLTFIGILAGFGLLAAEQDLLRAARIGPDGVRVSRQSLRRVLACALVALPLMVAGFWFGMSREVMLPVLVLCVVCAQGQLLVYNLLRLDSRFTWAQVVNNGWRILLLPALALLWFAGRAGDLATVLIVLLACLLLPLGAGLFVLLRRPPAVDDEAHPSWLWDFLLALGVLALLGNLDRVLVRQVSGIAGFGDYFYDYTLVVSPFLTLAGYVGFREFVAFKKAHSRLALDRSLRRLAVAGLAGAAAWALLLLLGHRFFLPQLDFAGDPWILPLLVVLAAIRLPQALLSALVGARADIGHLRKHTLALLAATVLGVALVLCMQAGLYGALLLVAALWLFRTHTYYRVAGRLAEEGP